MRIVLTSLFTAGLLIGFAGVASAHAERDAQFPSGAGSVPTYRTTGPALVVCKDDSAARIAALPTDARLRSAALLDQCRYEHIQEAVNAVTQRGTRILVLPGVYREEPSRRPPADAVCQEVQQRQDDTGIGGAVILSYEEQYRCPHVQNLIAVLGDDDFADGDYSCNNALCDLQIEGTGFTPEDVVIEGGFNEEGHFDRLNGLRGDRADGLYVFNMTFQLFEFNALYILETDGFVIDSVLGRWNYEYGFLTFAVDHGLYVDCEGYGNGDSAIYPGSASDLPEPHQRYSVEITGCRSHHNALGYSGTAGNSVYAHDNDFFLNTAGVSMDSLFPDHPGLPQDSAKFENNRIYSNNVNYFRYAQDGTCQKPAAEVGYERGVVCPVIPAPLGTGALVAGGNTNHFVNNQVWDNWRTGFMQFTVPAAFRDEYGLDQTDTSHFNEYRDNRLGLSRTGLLQPNGTDFWWDEQGEGNCFEGNVSAATEDGQPTFGEQVLPVPDSCADNRSGPERRLVWPVVKTASLAPCVEYHVHDNPDPTGCPFVEPPAVPEGREGPMPATEATLGVGAATRQGGVNRFATAAETARSAFPDGAGTALLARADHYPDALAGAFLAGLEDAPILLTAQTSAPRHTTEALAELGVEKVILLGGTGAISDAVASTLRGLGYTVERVGGVNRYDTARLVAARGSQVGTVILASGEGFADALAAGPLSYAGGHPIVLTPPASLGAEARAVLQNSQLGIGEVIIAGGTAAVSAEVERELFRLGLQVRRVAGRDRTETAARLADVTAQRLGWVSPQVHLALGADFPDALTLSPLAGRSVSVLLLARSATALGEHTEAFLQRHCLQMGEVVVAGGTAAVTDATANRAAQLAIC